jgi:hypothetical protein
MCWCPYTTDKYYLLQVNITRLALTNTFPASFDLKNAVFWDVALCRSRVNRRFGGTHRLHLQVRKKFATEELAWAGGCRLSRVCIMALVSIQPLMEMSIRNFPGVKKSRRVRPTILPPSVTRMSENVGASTSRKLKGLHGLYRDTSSFTLCESHFDRMWQSSIDTPKKIIQNELSDSKYVICEPRQL